ncbi:replication initiation protein [Sporosarcina sp. BP05]|uniref:replication initiation protein n=1 Tax=Sporosarcina sp. BP05 TaxID=2758726 RepID=UPI001646074E|nr:replication initiation protein [Sporosarcina sp. BP05]
MNKKFIVAQSNELITARHNNPLTSREQKLILAMVSEIQPDDEDFKEYRISLKNFNELLGLKGSTKYTQMREIMENLMKKTIQIPRKDKGWLLVHWVSSAEYVDGSGVIELTFSPKLKPYLLQLQQYTSYKLSNILSLNSTYSIRLYEIIKRYSYLGTWDCPLENLREMIGVQEDMYKQYGHFKSRVLKRAVDEVNEKTDVKVVFEEIKKGRSVDKIKFTIRKSSAPEIEPVEETEQPKIPEKAPENADVRTRLNGLADKKLYQFTQNYFSQLYQGALFIWGEKAENELVMLIEYVNVEKSVQNPLGFIKSQIQLAWEAYERGEHTTFADLQPTKERTTGREEIIPDWFKKNSKDNEPKKEKDKANIDEEREALLKELGIQKDHI